MRINRHAVALALLWSMSATLALSLGGYLLSRPEPVCPRGQHFVYPLEQCIGTRLFKGVHLP